jgi:hypothetical protein
MIRNLDFLRDLPEFGPRLYEALSDLDGKIETVASQTNTNTQGPPKPPPAPDAVDVTGRDGYLHVSITDNNTIFRGIEYWVEHADNPHFTNPQVVAMHGARNTTIPVGNQSRYVRVFSSYPFSVRSEPVYYGGLLPISVNGGGSGPGPEFLPSQGSGTGAAGEGLSGPGPIPFRSVTGAPPIR